MNKISTNNVNNNSINYQPSQTNTSKSIPLPTSISTDHKPWNERALEVVNAWDAKLEKALPNFLFQTKIDEIGLYIEETLAPLSKFNAWLSKNHGKHWVQELAISLAKLPLKAIRNIVQLIYNIIYAACYTAVHPLKSLNQLAKLIVTLIHKLTLPETWSKIGAGTIGGSLGHSVITGNPLSLIGIGIGGAMVLGGLSCGALKAAIYAEEGKKLLAAKDNLKEQCEKMPESFLTGFCMGILIGGIQKATQGHKTTYTTTETKTSRPVTNQQEAQTFADQYVKEHNLPAYSKVGFEKTDFGNHDYQSYIEWNNTPKMPPKIPPMFTKGGDIGYAHIGGKGENINISEYSFWNPKFKLIVTETTATSTPIPISTAPIAITSLPTLLQE